MHDRSMIRTRWAAVGAAVAVSIGAGGVGLLEATSPGNAAAFVPVTPCRLFDTRPDSQVGGRSAPLGPNDTYVVPATGDQGQCIEGSAVPPSARGLALNVTAVGATQATYLTLWPAGTERPNASSLNPAPGQPPTPNAVTTDLNNSGEFAVYNRFGDVHVIADIVGYYTDHHHDDRYYTEPQVDAAIAASAPRVRALPRTAVGMEMYDHYQKVGELGDDHSFEVSTPVWVLVDGMVEMHHFLGTGALPITLECYASLMHTSGTSTTVSGPAKMEVFGESNHNAYINMPLTGAVWVQTPGQYDVEVWCHRNWPTNYEPSRSGIDAVQFSVEIIPAPQAER
jgi:hypothetical protein